VVFDKAAAAATALRAAADGKGLELELPEPDQPYGLKGTYPTLYPCPCSARARVCPPAVCPAAAAPRLPTPRTAGALRRSRAGAWRAQQCRVHSRRARRRWQRTARFAWWQPERRTQERAAPRAAWVEAHKALFPGNAVLRQQVRAVSATMRSRAVKRGL